MDGVLEQILAELKDIKQLIATSQGSNIAAIKVESVHDTMKTKEAAEYLGIALHRLRMPRLVTTFVALGGQELQINVVDAKTLSEAVKMPEKHRDLVVRVARYSAYFARLDPDVQNEIISRTEQAV